MKDFDQDLPRTKVFEGHRAPVPVYVDDQNVAASTGCGLVAVDLSVCRLRTWFTEPHQHESDEVYVCVEHSRVVTADVEIEGVITAVHSPFVVRIPAGRNHRFRPMRIPNRPAYILGLFPVNNQHKAKGEQRDENDSVSR